LDGWWFGENGAELDALPSTFPSLSFNQLTNDTVNGVPVDGNGYGDGGGSKTPESGVGICACSIKMAGEKPTGLHAATPAASRRQV
jgi:hypothetical protein